MYRDRALGEIDHHVARPRVSAARLPDAAGIEQIIGVITQHRCSLATRVDGAAVRPKLVDAGLMGMTERAEARAGSIGDQRLKALLPLLVGVEAHGRRRGLWMQRAVHRDKAVLHVRLQRQPGQKLQIAPGQPALRPCHRACGGSREVFGRHASAYREVVIAGDAERIRFANERDAFGRIGIVADNVAETDNAVGDAAGDVGERCPQCLHVGVDVGDEGESHGATRITRPNTARARDTARHAHGVCLMKRLTGRANAAQQTASEPRHVATVR